MNAVGIDVSKGKSTVAVVRPFGEIVALPFEVTHIGSELSKLAEMLKNLKGETRVVMECTGSYHLPIAFALHEMGLFVSTINAQLTHDFGNNTIRKAKTDKADAIKIANYGIANWQELPEYVPEQDVRQMLKAFSRQYSKYIKLKTMLKNNLISMLDQTFPGVNELFKSPPRKSDGHEKWLDFSSYFWHCECVCSLTPKAFYERYQKWCKRSGYNFSQSKAEELYVYACGHVFVMPKSDTTKLLITHAIAQVNAVGGSIAVMIREMHNLAKKLPEYDVVMNFRGVGEVLGSQLIAEIGDIFTVSGKSHLLCALPGLSRSTTNPAITMASVPFQSRGLHICVKLCFR